MTDRRLFLLATSSLLGAPMLARAQRRTTTIGIIGPRAQSFFVPGIRQRLAELGYKEGPAVRVEYRHADGAVERFPALARELAGMRCDLVFAVGPEHAPRALLEAGISAPIVFLAIDYDPLESKIVQSLARPGRNITGLYARSPDTAVKRLEIAREVLPSAKRFLVLADSYTDDQVDALRKGAEASGTYLSVIKFAQRPYDFAAAFDAASQQRIEGLVLTASPVLADGRAQIHALSLSRRLPVFGFATPEGHFLASFGADDQKMARRVAEMGVQILKGAKPGDIPVHQADEFNLLINLAAAKTLGIKIPYSVLARATRLIE